ncbi:MAG: hypothetical protein PCFJNLEI_01487 [Verrucomicrobiae bacterium]|nr:hypothetical protein [Verrucomicrobiae bacterium]
MRNSLIITLAAAAFFNTTVTWSQLPPPTTGIAATQFRRTVDPSDRSASGSATFRINGAKQTATVEIKGLGETDFAVFVGDTPQPDDESLIEIVSPLDRTNEKTGTWARKFASSNGSAPLEFPVDSLSDLSGGIILIGRADDQLLLEGVTNIVNGVTNIIVGIPLFLTETNTVGAVLWAPIPDLVVAPSVLSSSAKAKMVLPAPPAASPKAKGTLKSKFNAVTGQSIIEIRASGLLRGQTYNVLIGDSTNQPPALLIPAGEMTPNKSGSQMTYVRDTAYGDPLPQQVRNITDLSGRRLDIRDNFGNIHLSVVIP